MSLDDLVSLSISSGTRTPTRSGFGTALLLVAKVPAGWGANRVRTFGSVKELTDAGFTTTDAAYLMASALKAQNPSPKTFKVGKRALPFTKLVKLTVTNATEGFAYSFKVGGETVSYTVPAAATTTSVATALAAAISALSGSYTATSAVAVITITDTAGKVFDVSGWREMGMTLKDDTTDPGIATDLNAVLAEDNDWYGLAVDSMGEVEAAAAASWVETNKKIMVVDTSDSECLDNADSDDVMSTLEAAAYTRSAVWFSNANFLHYTSCAVFGSRLSVTPGSDTWKFKTLAGVTKSVLTAGEIAAIKAKHGNWYTEVAGINVTEEGWSAAGEYMDVVRFLDWLKAEMQTRVFAALANAEKIPYTNAGVDVIRGIMQDVLMDGVKAGGLSADPEPTTDAPRVEDIDSVTKGTRTLPDVTFTGTLAGAIHALEITGTVSV